ncbi:glycosyltransferase [bacterium]|nr:glycosyltransferase [bacterium]
MTDTLPQNNAKLVVVMPAHNAEATVGDCLDALIAAGFVAGDITVVDDGSRDRTAELAEARGVNMIRNAVAQRPAEARNIGAAAAGGDIILFVDSDVCVHADVRAKILEIMNNSDISGVIGSYDDAPRSASTVGRYRNLLHAHTHQNAAGEVPTFWTGLGALRREAFDAVGGLRSDWENIEDVELGLKVTENGGRIQLDPRLKGKHLKDWSLASMFKTDLFGRAVPWTRLLRSGRMPMGVLSTTLDKRVSAGAIAVGGLSVLASSIWPAALGLALLCLLVFIGANAALFTYLAQTGGAWFAVRCVPLHAVHHLAGLLGYAKVVLFRGSAN